MKILHMCLSNFYIDYYQYQENVLPKINKNHGNDVRIIASCETFIDNKRIGFVKPSVYETEYGVEIERIAFKGIFPAKICKKLGLYKRVYTKIENIEPDVILYHGCAGAALLSLAKYKKNNPNVRIFIDSHQDFNNSGRNFVSKNILHGVINRYFVNKASGYVEKIFFLSKEAKDFLKECFGLPDKKLELLPLGGVLVSNKEYEDRREEKRRELRLEENELLFVHSGKLDRLKKTKEILEAFKREKGLKAKLVIIGSIPAEQDRIIKTLIEADERVIFLGWKTGEELQDYLCACDVYLQPGSHSATMQNAACKRAALLVAATPSYKDLLKTDVFWIEKNQDILTFFKTVKEDKTIIAKYREASYEFAKKYLDYEKIASKIY